MGDYIKPLLRTLDSVFALWNRKDAIKYEKQRFKLEKEYDEEKDKDNNPDPNIRTDRNRLDRIERDIVRLSDFINSAVKGSQTDNMRD